MTVLLRRRGVSAPSGFDPSSVAGLQLFYKADGTLYQDSGRTTPAAADGDPVGSWSDASSQAAHAGQATSTKRPLLKTNILNGKPVLRFDAVDDALAAVITSVAQPATWFIVCSFTANAAQHQVLGGGHEIWYRQTINDWNLYAGAIASTGVTTAGAVIVQATFNGVSSKFRSGGGAATTTNPGGGATGTGLTLGNHSGAARPFGGDVAEVLLYNSALSLANLDLVGNYLAAKYGLTWAAAS